MFESIDDGMILVDCKGILKGNKVPFLWALKIRIGVWFRLQDKRCSIFSFLRDLRGGQGYWVGKNGIIKRIGINLSI